jgi:hypothetical protein
MKYTSRWAGDAMIYIPRFIKIGLLSLFFSFSKQGE